eukprot:Gb_22204 [translate_table: standard]
MTRFMFARNAGRLLDEDSTVRASLPSIFPSKSFTYPTKFHSNKNMATLAYEEVKIPPQDEEEEAPPSKTRNCTAIILHGLMGSGRNWRSFARQLGSAILQQRPLHSAGWRMVLVDLRNHGRSAGLEGFDPPHDMSSAAKDVADLVKAEKWVSPDVVIGHSMGGKVALDFAESCARGGYGGSVILPKQNSCGF